MSEVAVRNDYEFFLGADLSEYAGHWVAIIDGKVVATGTRADEVIRDVTKTSPGKKFLLSKIPEPGLLILDGIT